MTSNNINTNTNSDDSTTNNNTNEQDVNAQEQDIISASSDLMESSEVKRMKMKVKEKKKTVVVEDSESEDIINANTNNANLEDINNLNLNNKNLNLKEPKNENLKNLKIQQNFSENLKNKKNLESSEKRIPLQKDNFFEKIPGRRVETEFSKRMETDLNINISSNGNLTNKNLSGNINNANNNLNGNINRNELRNNDLDMAVAPIFSSFEHQRIQHSRGSRVNDIPREIKQDFFWQREKREQAQAAFARHSPYDAQVADECKADVTIKEVVDFVGLVRDTYKNTPNIYDTFLEMMKDYKARRMDHYELISSVSALFKANPPILAEFKKFCPPSGDPTYLNINNNLNGNVNNNLNGNINNGNRYMNNNMNNDLHYRPYPPSFQPPNNIINNSNINSNINNTNNYHEEDTNNPNFNSKDSKNCCESTSKSFAQNFVKEARNYLSDSEYSRFIGEMQKYRVAETSEDSADVCAKAQKILTPYPNLLRDFYSFIPSPEIDDVLSSICVHTNTNGGNSKCTSNNMNVNNINSKDNNVCTQLLSLMNLYTQNLISEESLMFLISPFLNAESKNLMEKIFEKFIFINTPNKTINFSKTIGSYKLLDNTNIINNNINNGNLNNNMNKNRELNNYAIICPSIISEDFLTLPKTQSREIIYRIEDERHYVDILIYRMELSLSFLLSIKDLDPETKLNMEIPSYLYLTVKYLHSENVDQIIESIKTDEATDVIIERLELILRDWVEEKMEKEKVWKGIVEKEMLSFPFVDNEGRRSRKISLNAELLVRCKGVEFLERGLDNLVKKEILKYNNVHPINNADTLNNTNTKDLNINNADNLDSNLDLNTNLNLELDILENRQFVIELLVKFIKILYGDKEFKFEVSRDVAKIISEIVNFQVKIFNLKFKSCIEIDSDINSISSTIGNSNSLDKLYRPLSRNELEFILNKFTSSKITTIISEKTNYSAYFLNNLTSLIDTIYKLTKSLQSEEISNLLNFKQHKNSNLNYLLEVKNQKIGLFDSGKSCKLRECEQIKNGDTNNKCKEMGLSRYLRIREVKAIGDIKEKFSNNLNSDSDSDSDSNNLNSDSNSLNSESNSLNIYKDRVDV